MYIVLEIQTNSDDTVGTLINSYEDRNEAESQYHRVLMSAAVSELPYHSAFMLTHDGHTLRSECYRLEDDGTPSEEVRFEG